MPAYGGMWTLSQVAQAIKNQDWTGVPPTVVEYLIAPVFVDGEKTVTLKGDKIAHEFKAIVMNYVETHYSKLK